MACCPKAGVGAGAAVKGDPKGDTKEGVWLAPKPPEGAGLNTNGGGAADGAAVEAAEGAAAPKPKEGAAAGAALAGAPKMKG